MCKASVQGERARGESGVCRDRGAVLQLPLVSLVSMGAGTKPRENGELGGGRIGFGGRMFKANFQS